LAKRLEESSGIGIRKRGAGIDRGRQESSGASAPAARPQIVRIARSPIRPIPHSSVPVQSLYRVQHSSAASGANTQVAFLARDVPANSRDGAKNNRERRLLCAAHETRYRGVQASRLRATGIEIPSDEEDCVQRVPALCRGFVFASCTAGAGPVLAGHSFPPDAVSMDLRTSCHRSGSYDPDHPLATPQSPKRYLLQTCQRWPGSGTR
jgi:hypothetical protein